ncbi:hypothetical protein [Cyclobacterium jeungdonense]|uniref:Outer membrane porin, OprD family n=1 Tax=Cyclobacterium jeungdonense TaxID=708087 RepID=A0ABT8C6W2_9BACT|nr:hypothetical protein [Cyclobacterium jeungdonense]MDN3687373.1 hypothetical protein [Cyclobacterium jeungdonense]
MKKVIFTLIGSFMWLSGFGQQDSTLWKPELSLGLRSYFMSTSYWEDYKEDYAWGQMARLSARTLLPHRFQVTAEYMGVLRVLSSDLQALDPRVPNLNRYEAGLFDVNNLDKRVFGKIGNLHLDYLHTDFQAKLGRMEINTPFINVQDGRLSPTFVEGFRWDFQPIPEIAITHHLIWGVSPRSTGNWFNLGESIGMYPVARDELGQPSAYFGHTQVDLAHVLDLKINLEPSSTLLLNHTLVQNIYSTYLAQWDKTWELPDSSVKGITGLQSIVQHGIGDGGNEEIALRYKNPEDFNWILSGRIGLKSKRSLWHVNYTKMGGNGRFLSPREWGKDPFYTFIPRERNEGLESVDAVTTYFQHAFPEKSLQAYSYLGIYYLPDPANAKRNKYALPSYAQANLGLRYAPKKWIEGLNVHLILMSKTALDQKDLRPAWVYNKVNLFHVNAILNYTIPWK